MIDVMKSTTKTVMAVLLLTVAPAVAISVSATPAFAKKGGNSSRGKSNGSRGNRDARPSRRDAQPNGNSVNHGSHDAESTEDSANHGAIASELKGLNAAHASQNGLENSSPNSMRGKLYTYQQAMLAPTAYQDASEALDTLTGEMAELDYYKMYPDGDYEAALSEAQSTFDAAKLAFSTFETDAETSLFDLIGEEELTDEAMAALLALLGL
jgi:hypothetical protein